MSFEFTGAYGLPGIAAALETVEKQFWWGRWENQIWVPGVIEGAARDSGNTNYTDVLRPGLLIGQLTSNSKLTEFDPAAADGSQRLFGVLGYAQKMQRLGSNQDRWLGWIQVGGALKPDALLIPGETSYGLSGNSNEHLIRAQFHPRFIFSDNPYGNPFGGWRGVEAKTADYTVVEGDNNILFTNRGASGAVNFTLPATAKKGLRFGFMVVADQNVVVTAGTADTMVVFNDPTADSIAFSTSAEKVGGMIEVIGDGTGWLTLVHLGAETQTPTIVTA